MCVVLKRAFLSFLFFSPVRYRLAACVLRGLVTTFNYTERSLMGGGGRLISPARYSTKRFRENIYIKKREIMFT